MGALLLFGLEMVIGLVIAFLLTIIGVFIGNICLFESIASGIILGSVAHAIWHLHPALAVGIGLATVAVLYFIQLTKVGFWIVGGIFSIIWGFIVGLFFFDSTDGGAIRSNIAWAIGALAFMGLHLFARSRQA